MAVMPLPNWPLSYDWLCLYYSCNAWVLVVCNWVLHGNDGEGSKLPAGDASISLDGSVFKEGYDRLKYVHRHFIRIVGSVCPICLVLDDCQWADKDSLEWIKSIVTDTIVPGAWPLDELYATYIHDPEGHLLMPHVGGRRCLLDWHHPVLERLVEIGSAWGQFPWLYQDTMRHGYKLGVKEPFFYRLITFEISETLPMITYFLVGLGQEFSSIANHIV